MRMDAKRNSVLLACFLFLSLAAAANRQAKFPNYSSEAQSSDGRYAVKSIELEQNSDLPHALVMVDRRTKEVQKFYEYGRHVEVQWAPASDNLLVNDFDSSSSSRSLLLKVGPKLESVDLEKEVAQWLKEHDDKVIKSCDHVYIFATRWAGDESFDLVVTGYGSLYPRGFSRYFVYKFASGLTLIKSTSRFAGVGDK